MPENLEAAVATQDEVATIWAEETALRESDTPAAKPVVAPVVEAPKVEEPAPVVKPEAAVATDPLAGLPPEVKTQLESVSKLAERMRNLEGHIGGLTNGQKQIRELLTASQEAAKQATSAPTDAAVKAAAVDPEKWAALKKDFPEWSTGVEALLDSRLAGVKPPTVDLAEVDRRVEAKVKDARDKDTLRREIAEDVLDATPEFEGWRETIKTQAFGDWYNKQTDDTKKLASSDKYSDAAKLLRLHKKDSAPAPAAPATSDAVTAARQKVLEAATGAPKGKSVVPTKGVADMTPQELWAHEAKIRDKAKGL